jgi:hypothetical protein
VKESRGDGWSGTREAEPAGAAVRGWGGGRGDVRRSEAGAGRPARGSGRPRRCGLSCQSRKSAKNIV